MTDKTPESLTVAQVAEKLNVKEAAVTRWLRQGRLKGIRLGGPRLGWRISETELRIFLNNLRRQQAAGR